MSEPTSGVAENPPGHRPEALTPEAIEAVLADFRSWLQQLPPGEAGEPPPADEAVDLHTLLGQFLALKQEVNLQTRAVRSHQEQGLESLQRLGQALDLLQRAQAGAQQADQRAQEDLLRPLLKTLVDLYDALALARQQVARAQDALLPLLEEVAEPPEEPEPGPPPALTLPSPAASGWGRWFGAGGPREGAAALRRAADDAVRQALQEQRQRYRRALQQHHQRRAESAGRVRQVFDSVVTGYTMSLQRVERTLRQYQLEEIPCEGRPFDPELMEAVEVVAGGGRAAEVVGVVRRGYLWRGRVFRFAQVRVAKPESE
jgi:molecular chaperone GrpE